MRVRPAAPEDAAFLADLLVLAADWRGRGSPPRAEVERDPHLWHYVAGWPWPGDVGVVAVDESGARVGGAWARLLPADDPGYGWVAADVPEVAMAVLAGHRGRGVGRALLDALVEAARRRGQRALSLSVEDDNPAARLYASCGFRVVGRADGAATMLRDLGDEPPGSARRPRIGPDTEH